MRHGATKRCDEDCFAEIIALAQSLPDPELWLLPSGSLGQPSLRRRTGLARATVHLWSISWGVDPWNITSHHVWAHRTLRFRRARIAGNGGSSTVLGRVTLRLVDPERYTRNECDLRRCADAALFTPLWISTVHSP